MSTPQFIPMSDMTPKKPSLWRRVWPIALAAVLGLGIGAAAGGAASSEPHSAAQPAPVETVTVEVPVEVEVEPDPATAACREAASELLDMLNTMTYDVALPQNEVIASLVNGMMAGGPTDAELGRLTGIIESVTSTTEGLTSRMNTSVGPLIEACGTD